MRLSNRTAGARSHPSDGLESKQTFQSTLFAWQPTSRDVLLLSVVAEFGEQVSSCAWAAGDREELTRRKVMFSNYKIAKNRRLKITRDMISMSVIPQFLFFWIKLRTNVLTEQEQQKIAENLGQCCYKMTQHHFIDIFPLWRTCRKEEKIFRGSQRLLCVWVCAKQTALAGVWQMDGWWERWSVWGRGD